MADDEITKDILKIKKEALRRLKWRIGSSDGKHLTVAVIGAQGVGKSCFINTMITSMIGDYREWSKTGNSGGYGKSKTHRLTRIPREKYLEVTSEINLSNNFPNFLDMAGFENSDAETIEELFNLIIYGRIPFNVPLYKVASDIRNYDRSYIDQRYPRTPEGEKHQINRVIFVHSATNPQLPDVLIKAITSVLGSERDIPIFGVLTNEDRKKDIDDFEELEKNFKGSLQLPELHYLLCTTYCDKNIANIKSGKAKCQPHLDVPVLKFLVQVLDPVLQSQDFDSGNESLWLKLQKWYYKKTDKVDNNTWFYITITIIVLLIATITMLLSQR